MACGESQSGGSRGKPNDFIIFRYVETILTLMNPITPHFCQYVWQTHVYPALQECKNHKKPPSEYLIKAGWPEPTGEVDVNLSALFSYLRHNKHEFQKAYDT